MVGKDKTRITISLTRDCAADLYALATFYRMTASELVELLVEKMADAAELEQLRAEVK